MGRHRRLNWLTIQAIVFGLASLVAVVLACEDGANVVRVLALAGTAAGFGRAVGVGAALLRRTESSE